jgi:hypothetical protein
MSAVLSVAIFTCRIPAISRAAVVGQTHTVPLALISRAVDPDTLRRDWRPGCRLVLAKGLGAKQSGIWATHAQTRQALAQQH